MEQWEQWNSDGGKVKVEQWGRKVEQCWLTVKQRWWNRGTVIVEKCGGKEEQCGWNIVVDRFWWNTHSGTSKKAMVEQWNSDGGTVIVEQCGGKVEQCGGTVLVEQ